MTDDALSPEARALLDAARPALGPDPAAIARMHHNIAATAGAATVGASTAASASTKAAAGATGGSIGIKLGALAVIGALAIGVAVVASRDRSPSASTQAPPSASTPARVELHAAEPFMPPSPAPESVAERARVGETDAPSEPSAPSLPVSSSSLSSASSSASSSSLREGGAERVRPAVSSRRRASSPEPASLAREVELIDQAMIALRRGNPADALTSIRAHSLETRGAGQLAEEAAAIEVEALCRLGRPEAATKLAAFDERFPRSAQRARLTQSCP